MSVRPYHHARRAGTSFTKAVRLGCAVMCSVVISNWSKTTGSGFEA